ncbi:hypothetical protein M433DRAFT_3165 [Acidomyces richmondensis BFW]|nr:MAG: hypothetical protein FE78DRAFT_29780 [Acidomyces sp. 'richmondensis']KYG47073.1 hypothetical protein M433DRAFT_3165 [Acidomyces richmondensis BFW]
MNPTQLLDPKAFAKQNGKKRPAHYGPQQHRRQTSATANDNRFRTSSIQQASPHALLNPKSANSKPLSSSVCNNEGPRLTAAEEDEEGPPGMGSFIERMHNVTSRDSAIPREKRKVDFKEEESESSRRKKSNANFRRTTSGPLSEHMKKERQKHASEKGQASTPIEITDDEGNDGGNGDDDIVFVKENIREQQAYHNDEVCLGAIQGKANIARLPICSERQVAVLKDYWPMVKLECRRDPAMSNNKLELVDRAQKVCGTMELKLAAALVPLWDGRSQNGLRFSVYLMTHKKNPGEYQGQHVSQHLNISVVLFGPRNKTLSIGRYLSQKQLWLVTPSQVGVPINKELQNPHKPQLLYNSLNAAQSRRQLSQSTQLSNRTSQEIIKEARNMFDELVKHDDLPEMEPTSGAILTPLLPHQKQALYFLMQHEQDNTTDLSFSLWKTRIDKRGDKKWYHIITDQELSHKPDPVRGGILADMMGLGKTLSILSLISETSTQAREFWSQPRATDGSLHAQGTLIVCPKSVMSNWEEQIRSHLKPNQLNICVYHGSNREDDIEELAKYDIVLSTYGTVAAEYSAKGKALAALTWFRIVLDEAHTIRNLISKAFKGCTALSAQRRWAVTGTPVQNALEDLGALIKFLRIAPFHEGTSWSQYIIAPLKCANTDAVTHLRILVDSITLRRLKDKIDLKRRHVKHVRIEFPTGDYRIYKNMAGEFGTQLKRITGGSKVQLKGKAYAHVLKSIGRLRMFCAHGLDMFNEEERREILEGMAPENAISVDLSEEPELETFQFVTEKQAYEFLNAVSDSDTNRCEICDSKIGLKNSISGNETLDITTGDDEEEEEEEAGGEEGREENDIIGYLNPCYHLYCPKCKDKYEAIARRSMAFDDRHQCQSCEANVRFGLYEYHRSTLRAFLDAKNSSINKHREKRTWDESTYNGPSAKVSALLEDLKQSELETTLLPVGEPPIRSVIFSGWTTYLDLIEVALEENQIGFLRLDGSMSLKQRSTVLQQFANDPDITVILVSIKAGGQGLNFTAANKVYMMEPQFNPGAEHQAIDRVHRLGQEREVYVTHYIMKDSVEEGILKLQQRKEDLARLTLERKLSPADRREETRKRIEELKDLFK